MKFVRQWQHRVMMAVCVLGMQTGSVVLAQEEVVADSVVALAVGEEVAVGDSVMDAVAGAMVMSVKDSLKAARQSRRETRDSLWKPNPAKAVWLGAIVPGMGQIYNRKYWKLPIVYGAFVGCAYAISWNGTMYRDYKMAYNDIRSGDPARTSYLDILPQGYTVDMMGGTDNYTQILKTRMTRFHRYRDLSVVATVAVYALSLIDAYVDAQLFDYDITPDITLNVEPTIYRDPLNRNQRTAGFTMCVHF